MDLKRFLIGGIAALAVIVIIVLVALKCSRSHPDDIITLEAEPEVDLLYGIDYSDLVVEEGVIQSGQTISSIFSKYGVSPSMIDRTAKAADSVFSLRNIRAGNNYTAFMTADSIARLEYFVYEHNITDYLVISFEGDSVDVRKEFKDVTVERRIGSATITSSLWNAMKNAGMSPAMSMELSEIYAWTIDFFGLKEGDHFTVVYDEKFVDTLSVGVGRIWGAVFNHNGKDYYAIPFKQDGKISYWDQDGNSLRKALLKAPLKYSRISSKFSNSRMHPVLRIRRPHHGVDYAAPAGTPVHAVADGVVTFKGWDSKGGGNVLKIKHSGDLMTGYLHLRGFAKGIATGTRVKQGDLIGYVGSTGTSTGPHLDYRVWKSGKAVDPLSMTSEPAEPISGKNRDDFEFVKNRIIAELKGELPDSLKILQLDSLFINSLESRDISDSTSMTVSEIAD